MLAERCQLFARAKSSTSTAVEEGLLVSACLALAAPITMLLAVGQVTLREAGLARLAISGSVFMSATITCPACRASLSVGSAAAGQQVQCPRCQTAITIPQPVLLEVAVTETEPSPPPAGPTRPCPHCSEPIAFGARKCRHCRAWLDREGDEDFSTPRFKPCPRCGAGGANRVIFTFWGSFYGPALFTHVRCPQCGHAYNGKTGRSNLIPAILFVSIPAALILVIIGGLVYLIWSLT
jgi:predicted Zn finger-like uncharacterized protein